MMIGTILVPLDGSALAEGVLPQARRLAHLSEATLVLVRVVSLGPALRESLSARDDAVREARRYLQGVAQRLPLSAIPVRTCVLENEPAEGIVDAAAVQGADVIVMSTHGRSGVSRAVLGSVAERVLHETSVPVLLMRAGRRPTVVDRAAVGPYRSILVPLDGTLPAEQALRYVDSRSIKGQWIVC